MLHKRRIVIRLGTISYRTLVQRTVHVVYSLKVLVGSVERRGHILSSFHCMLFFSIFFLERNESDDFP